MQALSIRQPWAFAIVSGAKAVENRTWSSSYTGPLAIHASKKEDRHSVDDVLHRIHRQLELKVSIERLRRIYESTKGLGCIVGTVDMVGCIRYGHSSKKDSISRWFEGPHGFLFRNAVALVNPIQCRGHLGLWKVPSGIAETVSGDTVSGVWRYAILKQ